jgi:hypothetical protein
VNRDDFRGQADLVRAIPLEVVLTTWGSVRDRRDKSQWRTPRGPLAVTGTKFFNWHACQGGGGAIDLVMHLGDMDAGAAIQWLQRNLYSAASASSPTASISTNPQPQPPSSYTPVADSARQPLHLPAPAPTRLPRVRQYLAEQRCLAEDILNRLIDAGKIYADGRGNAVFLMVAGKANRPIGAELRGTGHRVWHGLALGSSRDAGYFWIGVPGPHKIILCESAIDAISCHQLHSESICISTAGIRPDAPWLDPLIARGYDIHCGFDADEAGETASRQMIARHPTIQRLRPPAHDWNDALTDRNK